MALFLSTFENKIDKKGRVSTPALFRNVLKKDEFCGFVAFRSLTHPCIEGFAMSDMEGFARTIDRFQLFEEEQADLTASVFADAQPLAFDAEGRVMLTSEMLTHADLTETVYFVGRGPTFQIWNPNAFKTYQAEARMRLKTKKVLLPTTKASKSEPEQ